LVAAFILYHVRFFIITPLKLFETPSLAGGFIADKKGFHICEIPINYSYN
jgi:hypothetical protein